MYVAFICHYLFRKGRYVMDRDTSFSLPRLVRLYPSKEMSSS
jgi:hypothetical protein